MHRNIVGIVSLLAAACGTGRSAAHSHDAQAMIEAKAPAANTRTESAAPKTPVVAPVRPAPVAQPAVPPPPSPEIIAKAKQLAKQGLESYRDGEYDKAETLLKSAITVYPFMADANLTLGRIFLIRGSATRDRTLIAGARMMFEMARAIDPNLREAQVLLDLFREAPPD
jgi:hypothetical protein